MSKNNNIIEYINNWKANKESPFLKLRKSPKNFSIDTDGYWSYPAFIKSKKGQLSWLCIILPAVPMPEKKKTALFHPKAICIIKPETCKIIKYENLQFLSDSLEVDDRNKPIALFPHNGILDLTYNALEQKERILLGLYSEARCHFEKNNSLPDDFINAYLEIAHPVFMPFLKKLTPTFFDALFNGNPKTGNSVSNHNVLTEQEKYDILLSSKLEAKDQITGDPHE